MKKKKIATAEWCPPQREGYKTFWISIPDSWWDYMPTVHIQDMVGNAAREWALKVSIGNPPFKKEPDCMISINE